MQPERSEVDEKYSGAVHRGNLSYRNGMRGGAHAQPLQKRGRAAADPSGSPVIPGATPIGLPNRTGTRLL